MTGSLLTPLSLPSSSPVHQVPSVDSFSEFSARIIHRASCSPTSPTSGSRSSRAKEEDEELFRDLFGNDAEAGDDAPALTALPFLPQKPATRRTVSSCGNPNPRFHLAPMKPVPLQPVLSTPFIPRLKLEELVNARPDDDVEYDNNNSSRRISRRGSDLEQVIEEDESSLKDARASCIYPTNNQSSSNNAQLEQETLQFLEKLELKAVLQSPRPDILAFYPGLSLSRTPRMVAKVPGVQDGYFMEKPDKERSGVLREKSYKASVKDSRSDSIASRLAYMESTYGTAPIARKTRRETINRLANPISGHSSTLQALSPKLREKREAALTSRARMDPISAAIAVSCRRGLTTKKTNQSLLTGLSKLDCEIPVPSTSILRQQVAKRKDPLVHKRRSNLATNAHIDGRISGGSRRKSKTTSLDARKEALKKKIQNQWGAPRRGESRSIGGSTFLTQRDDEEGVELVEDFFARHRGAQATLTFRSSKKTPTPSRNPATTRSRPRPPQTHNRVPFTRDSRARKSSNSGRLARTSGESKSFSNLTDRKVNRLKMSVNSTSSGPAKLFQQPRRPQAWQTVPTNDHRLTGANRPTTPGGSTPLFNNYGATADNVKRARSGSKKVSARKSTGNSPTFNAPTKVSEQRKRTLTTSRPNGGERAAKPRQKFSRRSTSRV
ncbi:hypothetical protein DVH05_026408 [Phytophthora capsici]|nr:hypothetical protein DVH05_026408 [Phytophthora capsici]